MSKTAEDLIDSPDLSVLYTHPSSTIKELLLCRSRRSVLNQSSRVVARFPGLPYSTTQYRLFSLSTAHMPGCYTTTLSSLLLSIPPLKSTTDPALHLSLSHSRTWPILINSGVFYIHVHRADCRPTVLSDKSPIALSKSFIISRDYSSAITDTSFEIRANAQ